MKVVKVGIIGIGNMGSSHVQLLDQGKIEGAMLTAICSSNEGRIEWVKQNTKGDVQIFRDQESFFTESGIDAVIIATPHSSHPDLAKKAFANGIHVLVKNQQVCIQKMY